MNKPKNRIKIIVPKGLENQPLMTAGTRVFAGEHELCGVTAIQLSGEVDGAWQAVITFGTIEVIDAAD